MAEGVGKGPCLFSGTANLEGIAARNEGNLTGLSMLFSKVSAKLISSSKRSWQSVSVHHKS